MAHEQGPREAEIEEVTSQLSEGMRTCRAMVANYRAMIADGTATDPELDPEPANARPALPLSG